MLFAIVIDTANSIDISVLSSSKVITAVIAEINDTQPLRCGLWLSHSDCTHDLNSNKQDYLDAPSQLKYQ